MIAATPSLSDAVPNVERLLLKGRVGLARVRRHKEHYWELDFGRAQQLGSKKGKRCRFFRKSATEAYRLAMAKTHEIKEHGYIAKSMSTALRVEAAACYTKITAVGASLTEAVDYFISRHPYGELKRTISEVVEEIIEVKRGGNLKKRYFEDLSWKLRKLAEQFKDRHIATITTEELMDLSKANTTWNPQTVYSYVQSWKVLFYFAMKQGYAVENPILKMDLPIRDDKEPFIFPVETVRKALSVAVGIHDCRTYMAIGFFAGIRAEEMEQLDWAQVDFENKTITVLTATAKGRARRIVDMSENLMAWIGPLQQLSGPVMAASIRVMRIQMREAMGLDKWPGNVMRHSFASYHYAMHRNEPLLMQLMGHGDDGRILHNHYRALVQPNAAKEYWAIFP